MRNEKKIKKKEDCNRIRFRKLGLWKEIGLEQKKGNRVVNRQSEENQRPTNLL